MPFFRSAPGCVDASVVCRHREQLNAITAFVDASMVYGSSDELARSLRNLSSPLGLLAHNQLHSDQGYDYLPYLPRTHNQMDPCAPRQGSNTGKNATSMGNLTFCYLAGNLWWTDIWIVLLFIYELSCYFNVKHFCPRWDKQKEVVSSPDVCLFQVILGLMSTWGWLLSTHCFWESIID